MKQFFIVLLFSLSVTAQSFAADFIGETNMVKAQADDTFVYLARDHNLGYLELVAANPNVDPWLPNAGASIILPQKHIFPDTPREGLVINLAEMRLYSFVGSEPISYPLGVGREGLETPTGVTEIKMKVRNPLWAPTERMREEDPDLPKVVEPGPDNPLGSRALYLGWPQYLIHGTNRPFGIGRRISSGCLRMYPEDILKLYDLTPKGTKVTVVEQPLKAGWIDDELYFEAHPNKEQSFQLEETGEVEPFELTKEERTWLTNKAGEHAESIDWDQVEQAVKLRSGVPVRIALKTELSEKQSRPSEDVIEIDATEEPVDGDEVVEEQHVSNDETEAVVSETLFSFNH